MQLLVTLNTKIQIKTLQSFKSFLIRRQFFFSGKQKDFVLIRLEITFSTEVISTTRPGASPIRRKHCMQSSVQIGNIYIAQSFGGTLLDVNQFIIYTSAKCSLYTCINNLVLINLMCELKISLSWLYEKKIKY